MTDIPPEALARARRAFPAAAPHALKAALVAAAPLLVADALKSAAREAGDFPPEAIAAAAAVHFEAINDLIGQKRTPETEAHIARVMLSAAGPHMIALVAPERARILEAARSLKFTLFRPGPGPAHGQSLDVVPLAELEALIGGDGP